MKRFNGKALYCPKGAAKEYSEWACNFFTGCSNDCEYCYCKRGVMSHVWDTTPHLKKGFKDFAHAMEVFKKELMANRKEIGEKGLLFSFTTDPMIPNETFGLTMDAVNFALSVSVNVQILTKRTEWMERDVWKRNLDFYQKNKDKIAIGFTLTGRDDLERGASSNMERILAMKKLHEMGFHTFASIEPIVDLESADRVISDSVPYCELFKIGLMSGGKKPDKDKLLDFVDKWNRIFDKYGKKVYWKKSVKDYLGDNFTLWMDSCVDADFNIFKQD